MISFSRQLLFGLTLFGITYAQAAVCDRSVGTVMFLEEKTKKNCEDIDSADLNKITDLYLSVIGVAFQEGDLEGLNSLGVFQIFGSMVGNLPENIFRPSPAIKVLDLRRNMMTEIPAKLFSNLKELTSIYIGSNEFRALSPSSFSGLGTKLTKLNLGDNPLLELSPELFHGLVHLKTLNISSTQIKNLPPNLFSEMSDLTEIILGGNVLLESLPDGIFDSLPHLEHVDLRHTGVAQSDVDLLRLRYPKVKFDF